jgi:hypothetical protein
LSDVTIKNGKIEDSNGNEINLENLVSSTSELIEFKKYISVDLDNKINDISDILSTAISTINSDLNNTIDIVDSKFSAYVDDRIGNILSGCTELNNLSSDEAWNTMSLE